MRKLALTICVLFVTLAVHAQASLIGTWDTGQDNTKVEITESKGIYEGRITSSDNPNAKAGSLILKNVKAVDGKWKGGLYGPKKKKWYEAVLQVNGNQLLATVKSGWMSQTFEWSKE